MLQLAARRCPPYEQLAAELANSKSGGASLADLQAAASKYGFKAEVRYVQVDQMRKLPVPFVAHLDLSDRGGTGHFILVFLIRENDVWYIDGFTGLVTARNINSLQQHLSGYVLVPKVAAWSGFIVWACVAAVLVAASMYFYGSVRNAARRK